MAQWSITCVLIGALIIHVEASYNTGDNSFLMGVMLIIINLVVVVLAIVAGLVSSSTMDESLEEDLGIKKKSEGDEDEGGDDDDEDDDIKDEVRVGGEKGEEENKEQVVDRYRNPSNVGIEMNPIHCRPVEVIQLVKSSNEVSLSPKCEVDSDDEFEGT